jgi:ABC-type branched-subunit amino acid transport system ATPase component
VHEVGNVLATLKPEMSVILVEQNLELALKLVDDSALLSTGCIVFSARPAHSGYDRIIYRRISASPEAVIPD